MHLRNSVLWFAQNMELKLRENDHKPDWREQSLPYLFDYLVGEVQELSNELKANNLNRKRVIKEATDVGNLAMMIADNMSR